MCRFIETICFEKGNFQRVELHNERFNLTRKHFFGMQDGLRLELLLSIPEPLMGQTVKCTVSYGSEIVNVDYAAYHIRTVKSLRLINDDTIDYAFKYYDRTKIASLYQKRGQCDDILIVKNGLITDTSYANIVFLKDNQWYSPQDPLLRGTRLKSYLQTGLITPALLRPDDLRVFSEARIINAMISIEDAPVIRIQNICI
ncbi:MAG: aminotransferase class IV [Mariniphaga sp.]